MNKNDIFENKDSIIRVLNTKDNKALIIDYLKRTVRNGQILTAFQTISR